MARTTTTKRREELLDAGLLAMADRGIAALRVRDVADRAGVSTGTVHYHFTDVDVLLLAIHERAVDRFSTGRRDMASGIPDARDRVISLAETGIPTSPDDPLVVALYELGIVHRRAPVHRSLIRALYEQQVSLYASALEVGMAQGHFELNANPWDLAANAVALEDAYGLHIISRSMGASRARGLLILHLSEVAHCDEIRVRGGIQ